MENDLHRRVWLITHRAPGYRNRIAAYLENSSAGQGVCGQDTALRGGEWLWRRDYGGMGYPLLHPLGALI